ncbi:restriction endonuclease subunit S [Polynucleobacter sphagniphilus]|jgi:type I restriction enzyme S subunit|uniref:restriction endonuclease subunit S n=1 Tax=Polynucleobacter sphagniphilus TaxID=1743169 RepID=UPI002473224E|nr:restriction endonuclease subunit S [Polynucleobacter sphagniphilus]MDH6300786.1 type I restriction enzyme S subunit [Polynucleobacter sphagniphilus]
MKAPKLRFKEFKKDWSLKRLGEITKKIGSGSTPLGGELAYVSAGIPFIRSQNVANNKLNLEDIRFIPESINVKMAATIVQSDDILLNITGASIGRSCVVPSNFSCGNVNQHVCIIRLISDEIPDFYQPYIASSRGQNMIMSTQVGGGREGLNFQSIRKFELFAPDKKEQQKIGLFLSTVDQKISLLTKRHELLIQYKKGVMQKIFNQEIRFKDKNGNNFPDSKRVFLGDIAQFYKGKGISKSDISSDGLTPCIRYGELYTQYGVTISEVISKTNTPIKDLILSKANDVIIPASGETQIDIATASCVIHGGIALGGDLNIIRTEQSGVFLCYYLNSEKKLDIAKLAQGNSVVHLYASQLKGLEIDLPTLAEQELIANFLSLIDKKIALCNAELIATKKYKQGLLQQMFI